MMLLRIVLLLFFLPFVFLALRRIGTAVVRPEKQVPVSTVRDPVCGVFLDPHSPSVLIETSDDHNPVYFCSRECRDKHFHAVQKA
ncbi:MAG: hypothetical protein ACYC9S_07060 [Leptospirales bacterium]